MQRLSNLAWLGLVLVRLALAEPLGVNSDQQASTERAGPGRERRLAAVDRKLEGLVAEYQRLHRDRLTLQSALRRVESHLAETRAIHQRLIADRARLRSLTARRAQLEATHVRLLDRIVNLESEHELLTVENRVRKDNARQDWGMTGAGVLLGGFLIGFLVSKMW